MLLLTTDGTITKTTSVQAGKLATCPMSSCSLGRTEHGLLLRGRTTVKFIGASWRVTAESHVDRSQRSISPPGKGGRKHPVIARNQKGETLLVWTEERVGTAVAL
jgi:hypothetical protein